MLWNNEKIMGFVLFSTTNKREATYHVLKRIKSLTYELKQCFQILWAWCGYKNIGVPIIKYILNQHVKSSRKVEQRDKKNEHGYQICYTPSFRYKCLFSNLQKPNKKLKIYTTLPLICLFFPIFSLLSYFYSPLFPRRLILLTKISLFKKSYWISLGGSKLGRKG